MTEAIPIILCGQSPEMATMVKNNLLPEFEVIHIILGKEAGIAQIPRVLEGDDLSSSENIGSQNYSKNVAAIVTGAGFDDEAIKEMREACEGKRGVPWLRPDMSKPRPPLGPEYGKAIVARVKACGKALVDEGKLEGDNVFYY